MKRTEVSEMGHYHSGHPPHIKKEGGTEIIFSASGLVHVIQYTVLHFGFQHQLNPCVHSQDTMLSLS